MINFKIKNVDDMTLEELVGQVIMIGLPGQVLDEKSKQLIKKYSIGNYILFARNYDNSIQMKTFMSDLYEYTQDITGSYPLVSIDQEGGMVVRLFKDVTFPASPLTTSATSVENAPYITGKIIASDMLKHGINLNLAPCLEINENLSNYLVNVRGYGSTKEIVCENAKQFVKGLQDGGVLSCIKHFPGAGSSTKDSHLELPIIDDSKEDLLNYNMYPFSQLIESDCLMTSHCLYSSFDSVPSTLSYELLTNILRNEMKFNGLIISDGMEMKAITDNYGLGNGCIMALNAGCDLLLLCHDIDEQIIAFNQVINAVKQNVINIEVLKEKVRRINKAKQKLIDKLTLEFTDDDYIINYDEHDLMQKIVDNSYTLIKGDAPKLTDKTLIITSTPQVASIVEDEFDVRNLALVLNKNFKCDILRIRNDLSVTDLLKDIYNNYDNFIMYSYDIKGDIVQQFIADYLMEQNVDNLYIVSLKGPLDLKYFKKVINYSCLYEYTPNSINTIVKQLKNEITLNGKLPK